MQPKNITSKFSQRAEKGPYYEENFYSIKIGHKIYDSKGRKANQSKADLDDRKLVNVVIFLKISRKDM